MAKKEGTAFRVKKGPKIVEEDESQEQAQVEEAAEDTSEEEAEESEETEEDSGDSTKKKKKPSLEKVEKAERPEGWVEFNCFEMVDPAPTIGSFSFVRDLSVTILESKKVYVIPREVAEVLVDKKKGMILP